MTLPTCSPAAFRSTRARFRPGYPGTASRFAAVCACPTVFVCFAAAGCPRLSPVCRGFRLCGGGRSRASPNCALRLYRGFGLPSVIPLPARRPPPFRRFRRCAAGRPPGCRRAAMRPGRTGNPSSPAGRRRRTRAAGGEQRPVAPLPRLVDGHAQVVFQLPRRGAEPFRREGVGGGTGPDLGSVAQDAQQHGRLRKAAPAGAQTDFEQQSFRVFHKSFPPNLIVWVLVIMIVWVLALRCRGSILAQTKAECKRFFIILYKFNAASERTLQRSASRSGHGRPWDVKRLRAFAGAQTGRAGLYGRAPAFFLCCETWEGTERCLRQ